jgi:hypothetical protein
VRCAEIWAILREATHPQKDQPCLVDSSEYANLNDLAIEPRYLAANPARHVQTYEIRRNCC